MLIESYVYRIYMLILFREIVIVEARESTYDEMIITDYFYATVTSHAPFRSLQNVIRASPQRTKFKSISL